MIIVLQCAASKRETAGKLRTRDGKPVTFVAHPDKGPDKNRLYAHPDDPSDSGATWREVLLRCAQDERNPWALLKAYELYRPRANPEIYVRLVERYGPEKVFILSAGWGLIGANFPTPHYDITFAQNAEPYKRRKRTDSFKDLCMLPKNTNEPVTFIGGKTYAPLFYDLTSGVSGVRTIFHNSATPPDAPGCQLAHYRTANRRNWIYECADAILRGEFSGAD